MPRKKRAVKGSLKCPKCDRTFSMPAHLGRHMATIHGATPKTGGGKKRRKRKGRVGRPKGSGGGGGMGGTLGGFSLEELGRLIMAARGEARRKIAAFRKAMK